LRILKFREFVRNRMASHDASHDIVHVDSVYRNFLHIVCRTDDVSSLKRETGALVALGHELCDRKYTNTLDCARVRADVEAYLSEIGCCSIVVHDVVTIIPLISFTRRCNDGIPNMTQSQRDVYLMVCDADILEALGMTGLVRTYMYQAVAGGSMQDAARYIEKNLFNAVDYLNHEWAREEGARRLSVMQITFSMLNEETSSSPPMERALPTLPQNTYCV